MLQVPDDIVTKISSFLWLPDLYTFSMCSKSLYKNTNSSSYLWDQLTRATLDRILGESISENAVLYLHDDLRILLRRLAPTPTSMDLQAILNRRYGPESISVVNSRVVYSGTKLGKDRAVIANCHFPCMVGDKRCLVESNVGRNSTGNLAHRPFENQSNNMELTFAAAPFTKGYREASNPSLLRIGFSCIAYFECSIYPPTPPAAVPMEDTTIWSPCISVGLSCPTFPLKKKQPGWDRYSFGYHSDDGCFFHGDGLGEEMGPAYGVGDVIGCGLMYPPLCPKPRLFFTRNGVIVGAYTMDSEYLTLPWFPTIGIDSYSPVEFNFGKTPFVFNVNDLEYNELAGSSAAPSARPMETLNNTYYDIILRQQALLSVRPIASELIIHPVLRDCNRYDHVQLQANSKFLNSQVFYNTRFLLDLMYLENLRSNGYIDEKGELLDEFYVTQEDMAYSEDGDFFDEFDEDDDELLDESDSDMTDDEVEDNEMEGQVNGNL